MASIETDRVRSEPGPETGQVRDRLTALEGRVGALEQEVRTLSTRVERLDQRVTDLKDTLHAERRLARLEAHAGLSTAKAS